MNDRQLAFCDCYLANGHNATQAYYEAGYKPKDRHSAENAASRLLGNVGVQEYLNNHAEELEAKARENHESRLMTAEELCGFWAGIITGTITETVYDNRKKSVVEIPAKTADRLKASELYGKYLGAFSTNVNVKTSEPIVIHNNVTE